MRVFLDRLYLFSGYAAGAFLIAIFVLMMLLSAGRPIGFNIPAGDDLVVLVHGGDVVSRAGAHFPPRRDDPRRAADRSPRTAARATSSKLSSLLIGGVLRRLLSPITRRN